jgi:hypothetical protein
MFMIYCVDHNNKHQWEHVSVASNIVHDNQPTGLSISITDVQERNFHVEYKWILANHRMTRGNYWGENDYLVSE